MSQHVVVREERKFVFGWDQPLMGFFLQVHDMTRDEDDQIVARFGATLGTRLYEVEDLVRVARQHDLEIGHKMQVKLYGEKDDGA